MKSTPAIHSISSGKGDPALLIHGLASSLHDWDLLMPALEQTGLQAFALDLPGHGESAKPENPEYYQVDNLYAALREWVDGLKLARPPLMVGHSLGGYLSLDFALRHPEEVRGLVLIDPLICLDQLFPLMRWFSRRPALGKKAFLKAPGWFIHAAIHFDPLFSASSSPETLQRAMDDYNRTSPNVAYLARSIRDLTPELCNLQIPCLVVWGERDLTLRPAYFSRLVEALPKVSHLSFQGCGHQPHRSRYKQVQERVIEFVRMV